MNARISFRIRILWMSIFNIFLFLILTFGIVELFIKSRLMGYLTVSIVFAILVFLMLSEIALRKYNHKKSEEKITNPQSPHRKMLEQMLNKIPNPPFNINAFLAELDDYYKYGLTKKTLRSRVSTDYNGTYIKIADGIRNGISPSSNCEKKYLSSAGQQYLASKAQMNGLFLLESKINSIIWKYQKR